MKSEQDVIDKGYAHAMRELFLALIVNLADTSSTESETTEKYRNGLALINKAKRIAEGEII